MDGISASAQAVPSAMPAERDASSPDAWPGFLLALAATSIAVGLIWDISWHSTVGRDTFWTPAHMAIYLGGLVGGCVGGWLAIKQTFLDAAGERAAAVSVFGARAPLGAWVAMWGAIAMLTSAPFDDWWHNAYGLDVKIVSPPHALLGFGMFGISVGALLLVLARQNRLPDGAGAGLFIYVGGIFVTLGGVFLTEYTLPNLQHAALFYEVAAPMFAFRLVALGYAGRVSWPATRVAAVYLGVECLMIWILPLFPAQPRLAPIFNPVTHMVPPAFPLLLIFPALAIDFVLRRAGEAGGWLRRIALALALGAIFLAVFMGVQWFFAEFLLSPRANNWFFAGNRFWTYGSGAGAWRSRFWHLVPTEPEADLLGVFSVVLSWALASFSAWVGLLWGGWMRKVKR